MATLRNVLFLCTGNTARSILFEGVLRRDGEGRFRAYSAGSRPKGVVNPFAVATLAARGYPGDGLRSKSWDEFAGRGAPVMDIVVTVCDAAAGEACPLWPGAPVKAHWGLPDPAAAEGDDGAKRRAFEATLDLVRSRVSAFLALPVDVMSAADLSSQLARIGQPEV